MTNAVLARALITAATGGRLDSVPEGLDRAALRHGISGLAWDAAIDAPGGDSALVTALGATARSVAARHMAALGDLAAAGDVLDSEKIRWLVLKGPVLTEKYYGAAHRRGYADLDLLVPGSSLEAAVSALEGVGGVLLDRNWTMLARHEPGALHILMPFGTVIDLHWKLLGRARTRFALDPNDMLDRAVSEDLGGLAVNVTAAEDLAAFVALDAALAGAHRLVWLADLDRIARSGLDWAAFTDRVRTWRAEAPVGLVLQRTRRTLGTPVPGEVTDALAAGWTGLVDRSLSPARSRPRALAVQAPARLAGLRPVAALSTLAGFGRRAATGRDANPTMASGGPSERSAYFAAAAASEVASTTSD